MGDLLVEEGEGHLLVVGKVGEQLVEEGEGWDLLVVGGV